MNQLSDMIMISLVVTNFAFLGSSRLTMYIRMLSIQGCLLALVPVLGINGPLLLECWLLSFGILILKGLVFPYLLYKVVRDMSVRREVEPFIGYPLSIFLGIIALILSLRMGAVLPLPSGVASNLLIPTSFFTIAVGMMLLVIRRKAVSQVLGYIVLENGIFIFGAGIAEKVPFIVDLGILLDVFVAVFIMGIVVFQIQREFDDIDTEQMATLRDI